MTNYRFINPNLVQRDDRMIAWDAAENMPVAPDEQKIWKDAGSPKPDASPPSAARTPEEQEQVLSWGMFAMTPLQSIQPVTTVALDKIKADLSKIQPTDTAALKQELEALTDAVRAIVSPPPPPQDTPTPTPEPRRPRR